MLGTLISRLRPLLLRIAPQGSRREKLLRFIYAGLRTWKNEGLGSAYRKAIQRVAGWLSVRYDRFILLRRNDQARNQRSSISPLDLRAVRKIQSIPSSYDVIILTETRWRPPFQSLQQLARRLAQDSHRVFYISAGSHKGTKTKVRPLEDGIFEVQLPGSPSRDLSSVSAHAQVKDDIYSAFAALRHEFGIVDAVCITDLPLWESVVCSLRAGFGWRIIYDCRDDGGVEKILNGESILQNSDLVLVSSHSLLSKLEQHNPNYLLMSPANEASRPGQAPDRAMEHQDVAVHNGWKADYTKLKQRIPFLFPKASIVIVTYNNVEYTRLCLNSIYENTIHPNFDVIVVDNASNDATVKFLKAFKADHENIQVIYNPINQGFARANNLGIAAAQGDYIVLLNNDTIVTRVWLSRLINYLHDQEVGLVGPVTNGVSNEACVEMLFTDMDALDKFATTLAKERSGTLIPIKMLAMYCIAGRRQVFQQVGPLDEQFGIGMFEDDDYSLRIRRAGYRIVVAEDVFIHHFGRSGFKLMGNEQYLALFEENRRKFETKWNIDWEQHVNGTLAENRRLAADLQDILNAYPSARGVIIFPPTIGWNISLFQRPHQLARAFAAEDFLVFFCTEASIDNLKGFRQVGHGLYLSNSPWGVFDLVERPLIFVLPYNRQYLFQFRQPRIVYEVIDDLDVFPGDKTQLQKNHNDLLKEADIVLVTADRLMKQVKQIRADALMCPNAVELEHFAQASETGPTSIPTDLASIIRTDRPVIGYYGALARWFDYDLVRQAAQKHPDWDFVLIGPNHDHTLLASNILSLPNIHWLGAREYSQLPGYLRHFSVATIPFLVNDITLATSPIKLFEYMAARKPIVTSDMPECRKYPGVLVARDTKEYIDHLESALTLTHDSAYLAQLYRTAQENTWEVRVRQIIGALDTLQ
jgi:GT2 family glycosyltransferase